MSFTALILDILDTISKWVYKKHEKKKFITFIRLHARTCNIPCDVFVSKIRGKKPKNLLKLNDNEPIMIVKINCSLKQ